MDDRRTILIIDDSSDDRALYRRYLQFDRRYTYHIGETDRVVDALEQCRQEMPDVILVDFLLHNSDGLEFLNQLKLQSGRTQVPVIFLTGCGDELVAVQALKSGAQDYLSKGKLTAEILCRAIHSTMERLSLLQQLEQSQVQQAIALQQAQQALAELQRTQTVLETSERLHRQIVETCLEGVWMIDPQHQTSYVNQRMAQLLGYTTDEMLGKSLFDFMDDEWRKICENNLRRRQQGINEQHDFKFNTKDGKEFWAIVATNPLVNEANEYIGALALVTDITDRKLAEQRLQAALREREQAEENLKQQQAFLQTVIDTDPNLIFVKDQTGHYLLANKAIADYYNKTVADLKGKRDVELHPDADAAQEFQRQNQQVIDTRQSLFIPNEQQQHPTRGAVWLQWQKQPIYLSERASFGVLGVGVDITNRIQSELAREQTNQELQALNLELEQRVTDRTAELVSTVEQLHQEVRDRQKIETALRESEARFRTMADSSPMMLWMSDVEGQANFFNQSWLTFRGRTHQEECGTGWTEGVHSEDLNHCLSVYQSACAAHQDFEIEYRLQRFDGEYRWVLDRGKPRFTPAGAFIGYIGSCIDISERKQAEDERRLAENEIRKALQKERELNELKSRFVSMISHEFRTPLTTIQTATDLLKYYEWSQDEKLERYQQIYTAVQHMTQLLEDVLLIGRAEAGKLDFNPKRLDLRKICQQLVSDFQMGAGSQHHLTFSVKGAVQEAWIDQKLLRQILTNLIANAIKYSPEGERIDVRLEYVSDRVILQVQDRGIGIPQAEIKLLFEAFFRASNVGVVQGTGLGLATVKRCTDIHQGTIAVESEVGKGTVFTVALPLTYAPDTNATNELFFVND